MDSPNYTRSSYYECSYPCDTHDRRHAAVAVQNYVA
jgi:hypothetical protein